MTSPAATTSPSNDRRIVPSRLRRTIGDPLAKRISRFIGGERFGVLWSTRRDGSWRTTALGIWGMDGRRYLVALFGETYWVADLRAGRPARIAAGGETVDVTLRELDAEQATDFWMAYARRFAGPATRYTGISREPGREEAASIAAGHAVFLIEEERDVAADEDSRPSWRRTVGIGLGLGVFGAVVNAALVTLLTVITGVDRGFQAIGVVPVALFTIAGMLAASAVFGVLQRRSWDPRRTWPRVATVALLVSWLPDLLLLVSPATPMGTATPAHVAILVLLHLPPFALAVRVLPALLGAGARASETA
jgi:hypothetical protein